MYIWFYAIYFDIFMLTKENRIRTVRLKYSGKEQIQHVHLCKDCGAEMFKTVVEEKISTGYCLQCFYNHRSVKQSNFDKQGDKKCNICLRFLPTNKFIKKKDRTTGLSAACSKCHNLKKYGINSIEYEKLSIKQKHKCAICGLPEPANDKHKDYKRALAVDHCHDTLKVRGLLCTNCNILIGHCKNSAETLKKAIKYLKNA